MAVIVKWVPPNIMENIRAKMQSAPDWMPQRAKRHMQALGPQVVRRMKYAVMENVYTGALQESIQDEYEDGGLTVLIAPTVMRGRWDGGSILEMGTRPIPRAPWAPIARWAGFRGLPAFPIVWKIRTSGVSPHPFLDRTLEDSAPDFNEALDDIVGDVIEYLFSER